MSDHHMLGIDIGGTGVKGAVVDLEQGVLATDRFRLKTSRPATPEAVAAQVKEIVAHFGWSHPFGCAVPAVVRHGVVHSAANIDKSWMDTDAVRLFSGAVGHPAVVLNDADAAGLAEMHYGAGRGETGTVIMLTFGTGIGSAVFLDGRLVPNTELGHLRLASGEAEKWASAKVQSDEGLSFKKWAKRVAGYMNHLDMLFSPEMFIVGGGISKESDKWVPLLKVRPRIEVAQLRNHAGIVGAAYAAAGSLIESEEATNP